MNIKSDIKICTLYKIVVFDLNAKKELRLRIGAESFEDATKIAEALAHGGKVISVKEDTSI